MERKDLDKKLDKLKGLDIPLPREGAKDAARAQKTPPLRPRWRSSSSRGRLKKISKDWASSVV
jgi:hypothetical protein